MRKKVDILFEMHEQDQTEKCKIMSPAFTV